MGNQSQKEVKASPICGKIISKDEMTQYHKERGHVWDRACECYSLDNGLYAFFTDDDHEYQTMILRKLRNKNGIYIKPNSENVPFWNLRTHDYNFPRSFVKSLKYIARQDRPLPSGNQ